MRPGYEKVEGVHYDRSMTGTVIMESSRARSNRNIFVIMFQLSVIMNSMFGSDEKLNILSLGSMLFFFVLMFVRVIMNGGDLGFTDELIVPIIFLAYMCLSVIWSADVSAARKQLWTEIQLFILFFFTYYLMITEGDTEDYFNAIYISGYGLLIFALIKYGGLAGYYRAIWSEGRVGGEIANENTFGMVFSNASIVALYKSIIQGRKKHWIGFALFALFGFSSGSKKTILMIALGIVGILILHYGVKRIYKALIASAAAILLGYGALRLPVFSVAYKRLDTFLTGNFDISDQRRRNMVKAGIEFFKERPVFGWGLNNYRSLYFEGEYSHNNFIELMVCLGLVGLVLYYTMYAIPMIRTARMVKRKDPRIEDTHLILLFMLVISFVFGYGMVQFYGKGAWMLIGVALAMVTRFKQESRWIV